MRIDERKVEHFDNIIGEAADRSKYLEYLL